jgi:hypothetical protein
MYLPQERLNEIARRRLSRVAFVAKPGATGALEGSAAFSSLVHPVTHERITGARFRVASHDRIGFLDGPLAAVEPVHFHDVGSAAMLEERLQSILETRAQGAEAGVRELQRLGVEARVNSRDIVATGEVAAGGKIFTLWAHGSHGTIVDVRVGVATTVFGGEVAVLDLVAFASLVELELELGLRLSQLQSTPAAPVPAENCPLVRVPPGSGVPLHTLLGRFGEGARASALEIEEDLSDGTEAFRMTAVLKEPGSIFHVTIRRGSDPSRPAFAETVDFAGVESTLALASTALGRPPPEKAAVPADKAEPAAITPKAGEVWIMMALVERDDNDEIRYVLADFDGRPYGAQRILKRADFLAVFQEQRGSYRLRVRIQERRGHEVVYRQLDGAGQPTTAERSVSESTFMSTFYPEAMAY